MALKLDGKNDRFLGQFLLSQLSQIYGPKFFDQVSKFRRAH
jgi:hypothetical protein